MGERQGRTPRATPGLTPTSTLPRQGEGVCSYWFSKQLLDRCSRRMLYTVRRLASDVRVLCQADPVPPAVALSVSLTAQPSFGDLRSRVMLASIWHSSVQRSAVSRCHYPLRAAAPTRRPWPCGP
jgi:hypothetical protein